MFIARHPEMDIRPIRPEEHALAQEWIAIWERVRDNGR